MKKIFAFLVSGVLSLGACQGNPGNEELPQQANSYFVAVDGNDGNDGSVSAPLKTINLALEKANAGDTVFVRAGTYHQKVKFPRSGLGGQEITLKAYPGEKPKLSGEGMAVNGTDAMLLISGKRFITVEGLEIADFRSTTNWTDVNGIIVNAASNNITLRRNHVHHIESNIPLADGRSGHAILIIGNTDTPLRNILVEENEINDCKTGYSENLTINGYVDGFIIRNNRIYNCENIGIDAAGGYAANPVPAYNYARNGVICGNEVFNVENKRGPIGGYGAIGIYVDGARNIILERNRVYQCDRGIGMVSETNDFPTTHCIARNNVVYDCWRLGIYMGGYLGYTGGGTDNCYIVNNTLYANNKVIGYFDEIEGEIRLTEDCKNSLIINNLVYSGPNDLFVHKYTTTGTSNTFDHNLYYGPGKWLWNSVNGTPITDFAIWKSTCGGDHNSIHGADPLFRDRTNADFSIPASSPAKNAGKVLPDASVFGETDFYGKPRTENGKISIGAIQ